jgi:16S rRNA processing protein RimM
VIQLIEAGKSYKVYGLKGELIIDLQPEFKKHILDSAVVFFMIEGNAVPFFIETARGKDELIVKFKEVDTPEEARQLSNQAILIDDTRSVRQKVKTENIDSIHSFVGYQLEDTNSNSRGIIKSITEYPSQLMATLEMDAKEYMIPIHEDWLIEINQKKKIIRLALPEGIFDL